MSFEKKYYESDEFWKDGMLQDIGNRIRIQETAAIIPSDITSLADIGCGNGRFGKYLQLSRPEIRIVGVDRSEAALNYVTTDKVIGEITSIPLKDQSFDCVSCLQVLEHIPIISYNNSLRELCRISNKYIVISVPYREKLEENVTQCPLCKTTFNVDLHLRSYDDNAIDNLLIEYGFSCKSKKNVVPGEQFRGIEFFNKIKNSFNNSAKNFNSPICPVCGFENLNFKFGSNAEIFNEKLNSDGMGNFVKNAIKKIWPRKMIRGYWMIALYSKN